MTTRVTAPILIPNTPDCDYPYGEELLSPEKIRALMETYQDYGLVDYEHMLTDKDEPFFMTLIGEPVRLFTNDCTTTFTDLSDRKITVPKDTLWLTSDITNGYVEKRIEDKESVAYSVTVAERSDADEFMKLLRAYNGGTANKDNLLDKISDVSERISTKRTMIKDIEDPVLFTVSIVTFPCVNKAMFCKEAAPVDVEEEVIVDGAEKMSDEVNNTFYDSLKDLLAEHGIISKGVEVVDDNQIVEEETMELDESVQSQLDEFGKSLKAENQEMFSNFREETKQMILEAVKSLAEDEAKPTDGDGATVDNAQEQEEDDEKPVQEAQEVDEAPIEPKKEEDEEEEEEEEEPQKPKSGRGGKGGQSRKGFTRRAHTTKSAQPPIDNPNNEANTMTRIHESKIIKDNVVNGGKSYKGMNFEEIDYSTKSYTLYPFYKHEQNLSFLNKAGKHVFAESFSEEETNKAILSTEMFSQYVRALRQAENIFQFIDYETVYGEEMKIRRIKSKKSYTSQDGHYPENYYFDSDPEATEMLTINDVLRPVTQRDKIAISDKQSRNNAFGNDLLDAMMDERQETFQNGVYAARILGSTALDGKSYTDENNTSQQVEKQFTRRDGLVAQSGNQLKSGTDFGLDNILELFDTMYYSLPEAAQAQTDYAFFIPTGVYRAYYNYFIQESRENKRTMASTGWQASFMDIPIYTSKTLSNPEFRTMLTGGDAKALLCNKSNSKLGVGRGLGIEPERHADTSSTHYYFTMDTDAKYVEPDYSVTATLDADEYAALTRLGVGDVTGDDQP